MEIRHWIMLAAILVFGYWLGRKYPTLLAAVPVIGS